MTRLARIVLSTIATAAVLSAPVRANERTDAMMVLTTVGYLTGAADVCKVVPDQSNILSSGMALAINRGNYGPIADAHVMLNTARQRGISDAAAGKVDCAKIADLIQKYLRSMPTK